jgi:hypothetical protein
MSEPKFGELAIHANGGEFQMSSEEAIRYGLEQPGAPHTPKLTRIDKVTNARIRYAVSELVAMNLDNVNVWLGQVAAQSPKAAIELMIELMQFTTPKLKTIAVQVTDDTQNPKSMTIDQLQKLIAEQG